MVKSIEKHIHSCDIGLDPKLYKWTKDRKKPKKMPKDKDIFIFKNKTSNKTKNKTKYKSKNNIYNLKDGRTHKGKNSNLKTKHQTKLSKSVFAKYHKIDRSARDDPVKRLRILSKQSGRRY